MTPTSTPAEKLSQIHALLASHRYSVSESTDGVLSIMEVDSGLTLQAVLQGDILFLSVNCATVEPEKITTEVMSKMLAADNGISTSHFQLFTGADGNVTVTLNNFCKLQDMGADDEDDILSCVSFLMADAVHAHELIGQDIQ